ncbi:MAG: flagellar type III secretion system pore protein FliP [Leptospiraceae bacterium]|nr:flagellar type III secretion system pore protein FliP [Leptospiraceae bacterium]MDW8306446.1 flagellar type III secretion system pore protein FliP [Leptospiraceae bacterium]
MRRVLFWLVLLFPTFLWSQEIPIPKIDFNITPAKGPKEVALSLQILLLLTLLSMAPAIILMLTSFTKIIIVFDFIKRALSLQNMPPNQVMVSLALFVTFFIMAPTLNEINQKALSPYLDGKLETGKFFTEAAKPLRQFMIRQLGKEGIREVALFIRLSKSPRPKNYDEVPFHILVPAFMLSELKKAFIIGIYLFIPFLIIDMVVASTLMSMGMIMLPPVMISLPFKIILFVLVDGWSLLTYEIVRSYGVSS